jgi:hypothetical protein
MPQFELEPAFTHYGNYFDNIITGSIFSKRVYMGSHVSGNLLFKSAKTISEYASSYGNRNAGSFSRNLKVFSKETIYSSIVPNLFEMYVQNGGKYISSSLDVIDYPTLAQKNIIKMYFGSYSAVITGSVGGTQVSDNKFLFGFPFSKEYFTINRLFADSTISTVSRISFLEKAQSASSVVYQSFETTVSSSNLYYLGYAQSGSNVQKLKSFIEIEGFVNDSTDTFINVVEGTEVRKDQMFKFLFGLKPYFSSEVEGNANQQRYYVFGLNIRGWKYGLYSGLKTNTSMIFRSGRFGQFRDTLEQRIFTKVFTKDTNTTKIPILISFVSGTEAALTASNLQKISDSGIYDNEYRSGIPWIE